MKHRLRAGTSFVPPPTALYAAKGGPSTTSDLYTLDPADGSIATTIGAIGFGVTGLAFHPGTGVLYGATNNNSASNPRSLISIDTTTGAGTLIGAFNISTNNLADLAFRSDGVLFGYGSGSPHGLYSVNLSTGQATQIGFIQVGNRGYGMDFDANDLLFVCPTGANGLYYTVNSTTSATTAQVVLSGAPDPTNEQVAAGSFKSPAVFWAALADANGNDYLATINTSTGVISSVGITLADIDAIAWNVRATTGAPHPN